MPLKRGNMEPTPIRPPLESDIRLLFGDAAIAYRASAIRIGVSALKRAFRLKAQDCHPDKAAAQGVDPRLLSSRFIRLQDAYARILEAIESGSIDSPAPSPAGPADHGPRRRAQSPSGRPSPSHRAHSEARGQAESHSRQGHAARPQNAGARQQNAGARQQNAGARQQNAGARQQNAGARQHNAGARPNRADARIFHAGRTPLVNLRIGQFLYYSGRIDLGTLIGSLAWQLGARPRLGELGIEAGYLDRGAVMDVLRMRGVGEPFGAAALRLGALDQRELSVLLGRQRLLGMSLGRYFVDRGHLDERELDAAVSALRLHNIRAAAASA